MGEPTPINLESPTLRREREFLSRERESRRLHRPWVTAPASREAYRRFLAQSRKVVNRSFFVVVGTRREIAGVVNISEMVLGPLRSAYLGFYALQPHAGKGFMSEGIGMALEVAFGRLGLHRLEANVQPENTRSIRLLKRLRFRREGFSPKYLKIGGRWRDHERWALLSEDWRSPHLGYSRPEEVFMTKHSAEHHRKAAEHHEHAARHHKEAAKHYESGDHEKAVHHALAAQGHSHEATHYEVEAAKSYVEQMRAVEAPFANRPQRARAETGRRPRHS